jgi:ATP adenylyltransferase
MTARRPIDLAAYTRRVRGGPCFLCSIAAHEPIYNEHHIIYEDEAALVFLSKYPTLYGYTLIAPRAHREHVMGDFTPDEYLGLQRLIYRVGEAIRRAVPCERLYVLSLGSAQGNSHVHWHLAPLPPGVPYEEQQLAALDIRRGVLDLSAPEMAALARRIRAAMD